ncbi:S1C family serine protease [Aliikangiella sp. IMCC44653]
MHIINNLIFWFKWALYGLGFGLLVLYFMPNSQLAFNWQTTQAAWHFIQQHQSVDHSQLNHPPINIQDLSFASAVEKAFPSVVSINVLRPRPIRETTEQEKIVGLGVGFGSGIFLGSGYIVTNYHVIANAERISVNLHDGRRRWVEIVGHDEKTDIAVLKTEISDITPAQLANSSDLRTGDFVMAIGNPFGSSQASVSLGIVSAVTHDPIAARIQTDAALNEGNSGGPLINANGQIVGINQISLNSKGGGQTGVNYAIPIDKVKSIVEDIIQYGKVRRNWLGIDAGDRISRDTESNGVVKPVMWVRSIEKGSPAHKAGILPGDFLIAMNGKEVNGIASFYKMFYETEIGSKVTIQILRDKEVVSIEVQLEEEL